MKVMKKYLIKRSFKFNKWKNHINYRDKKHKNIGVLENKLVKFIKNYKGKYLICSFEKDILFWFKKNKPNLKRGLILRIKSKEI
jgi:hypothetical protein